MKPALYECASHVDAAAVYERGALVTRALSVPEVLDAGLVELCVPGVTAWANPASAVVRLDGERTVLSVRAERVLPASAESYEEGARQLTLLERARATLEQRRSALTARRAQLLAVTPALGLARKTGRTLAPEARVADGLAASTLLETLVRDLDAQLAELARALREHDEARRSAQLAQDQSSTAPRDAGSVTTWRFVLRLSAGGPVRALELTYAVPVARWWPAHTARLSEGYRRARWELGAFVVQRSGEDWSRVRLSLCTAALTDDANLPELPSLRLGRAQPRLRKGYRAPPEGLDALFASFDSARGKGPPPRAPGGGAYELLGAGTEVRGVRSAEPEPKANVELARQKRARAARATSETMGGLSEQSAFETFKKVEEKIDALEAQAEAPAEDALDASALQQRFAKLEESSGADRSLEQLKARMGVATGESAQQEARPTLAIASTGATLDQWLDFEALTLAGPEQGPARGRLCRDERFAMPGLSAQQTAMAQQLDTLAGPPLTQDPRAQRGRFEHSYQSEGLCDVPSDGQFHRVDLLAAETSATALLRTAPREDPQVYREVELTNPFPAPLLGGPVSLFVDGDLVATSAITAVDRGGTFTAGLGVEERARVARNVATEESTAGLLKGSTVVEHAVTIELSSSLASDARLEVLECVPVSSDKQLVFEAIGSEPGAELYDQAERGAPVRGGLRWKLTLTAGGKAKVKYRYRLTLPSRSEIVGGNNRG